MKEVARFMAGLVPLALVIFAMLVVVWFGLVWATTKLVLHVIRSDQGSTRGRYVAARATQAPSGASDHQPTPDDGLAAIIGDTPTNSNKGRAHS